jgi:hypothetical protein
MEYKGGYNLIMLFLISNSDLKRLKMMVKKRKKEKDGSVCGW